MLTKIQIRNYRCLQDVCLDNLTKLNVLVGRNGVGKSTILDVLTFARDVACSSVEAAITQRGGFHEIVSRDSQGPIEIMLMDDKQTIYTLSANIIDGRLVTDTNFTDQFVRSWRMYDAPIVSPMYVYQQDRRCFDNILRRMQDFGFISTNDLLSRYASRGHLNLFSLLHLLANPKAYDILLLENVENSLHLDIVNEILEDLRVYDKQVFVTTHSPTLVYGALLHELILVTKDKNGYTQILQPTLLQGLSDASSTYQVLESAELSCAAGHRIQRPDATDRARGAKRLR